MVKTHVHSFLELMTISVEFPDGYSRKQGFISAWFENTAHELLFQFYAFLFFLLDTLSLTICSLLYT